MKALRAILAEAAAQAELGSRVFAQACPHVESSRPELSFAGCFRTYHPRRALSQADNITAGLAHVMEGRRNPYGDIYHARHGIAGERRINIKFANFVDRILAIGTAYVHGPRCLFHYFDSYLSLYANDPVRIYAHRGSADTSIGWPGRLPAALFAAADCLRAPLDIEFVVTAEGAIHVTQVRPISPPHLQLWDAVGEATRLRIAEQGAPSIGVNSVGRFGGALVDLRRRPPRNADAGIADALYVVHLHEPAADGTGVLRFLAWATARELAGFGLLVDHGTNRRNDHLDYILVEDPGAAFVIAATGLPTIFDRPWLGIESDGFAVAWH